MISIKEMRFSGSLISIRSIKSRHGSEMPSVAACLVPVSLICFVKIYFLRLSRSSALNGYSPSIMACSIHPTDHTSILGVDYVFPVSSSGDINFKLPAVLFSADMPLFVPKMPKSTNLILIPLELLSGKVSMWWARRIFWNLMSRWMIFLLWQ